MRFTIAFGGATARRSSNRRRATSLVVRRRMKMVASKVPVAKAARQARIKVDSVTRFFEARRRWGGWRLILAGEAQPQLQ